MAFTIIAIEREYASGGRDIGKLVASELGIPYYGREILQMAADRFGTTAEALERIEEAAPNSFLYSLYALRQGATGREIGIAQEDELYLAESRIIQEIAGQGPAVIVGRCASHVLRDRQDVLMAFVRADWEVRKRRAIEVYGDPASTAESVLKRFDRRRANYYNANTGRRWDNPHNYHIMLDSGKLGIEACVRALCACVR